MPERLTDEQVAWYAGTSRTAKWTADMAVHENIVTLAREVQAHRSSELQAIEAVEAFCGRKMPVPVPPDMRAVVVSHAEHIRDAGGHTPLTILARIMLQPWIAPTPPETPQ